jgi:glycosyltransferase involved in cell wall biosynthesis
VRDPLISVIMCVRNGAAFLREALDSIADQVRDDLQVIVVNDGSKDESAQIAGDHSVAPQVISQAPLGVGSALNHGIAFARAPFLAFLDADDVWTHGRIDAMLAPFSETPDTEFVVGEVVNTDRHLNVISPPVAARLLGAMLIRRASALRVGAFRTDLVHGVAVDWNGRAAGLGLKYRTIDRIVLQRRIHDSNMGVLDRPTAKANLLRAVRDHFHRRRQ